MPKAGSHRDARSHRAAISLLARGILHPGEIAKLAGVSLALVYWWGRRDAIDWRRMRSAYAAQEWRKEILSERPVVSKKRLRKIAEAAKQEWDSGQKLRAAEGPAEDE